MCSVGIGGVGADLTGRAAARRAREGTLVESGVPYAIQCQARRIQNLHGAKADLEQRMFSLPWPADMVRAATGAAPTRG